MKVPSFDSELTPGNARNLQSELSRRIELLPLRHPPRRVAGTDVAFSQDGRLAHAAVVVLDCTSWRMMESACCSRPVTFPYITGLLSFREIPVLLECFASLANDPDLIICDGQGIAHPRRLGLASHLGLLLGIPSIGCAKSRLVGSYEEPATERGSRAPLLDRGEQAGTVLRTRTGVKPVFVSPGHAITHPEAVDIVLSAAGRYRLPEPTRLAHQLAGREKSRSLTS